MTRKAKPGSERRGAGYPKQAPEVLWMMDPTKRPVDVMGFFSGTLAGGEDEVLAIAKGARTSFHNRAVDDRATIRGGLGVLHAAGKGGADPKGMSSRIFQGLAEDQKLVRAAGAKWTGKREADLREAANRVRRDVARHGAKFKRAAWGARGLYVIENMRSMQHVRGLATSIVSTLGPIGMLIGAAMGIHGAISNANAKEAIARFSGYVKAARPPGDARRPEPDAPAPAPGLPWGWIAGGIAVVAGIVVVVGSRKEAA